MSNKSKTGPSRSVGSKQSFIIPTDVSGTCEVLLTPVKSENDKKDYKVIRLENGLTACLISDMIDVNNVTRPDNELDSETESESSSDEHETEEESESTSVKSVEVDKKIKKDKSKVKLAAAALCVRVGSFSDPKEVPGLAHFLEHMVFMGSEKFPKENDFHAFTIKHGGFDNAQTDYENTTFYFECFEKYLYETLDKFSQFFISPLLKKDSMMREREAVESEFQLAKPDDNCIVDQLFLGVALESSPINSFQWGNLLTLKENINDDTLYQYLHEFRKRHYSAHRMTLAIQARLPLETLERYVVNCFSNVANNNLSGINFKDFTKEIFNSPRFNKIYYVNPIEDICEVRLTWLMPPLKKMYKTKPLNYLIWLLAHEGKGSVLSYLREKVWALELGGYYDEILSSIYTYFTISIILTTEGLNHLKEVIEAVFGYLKMLHNVGPSERLFKEFQLIHDTTFRFKKEVDAVVTVKNLAQFMQVLPPEDYLTGLTLLFEYDPTAITEMLNGLTPAKVNVIVLSKNFPSEIMFDKTEPWFKTKYAEKDIYFNWMECWLTVEPLPCLKLPEPNPFITEDFTILPVEENIPSYPEKILESSLVELWYRKDQEFKLPMAHYYYYFLTPLPFKSAESSGMVALFISLLILSLAEEGYHAILADISYSMKSCDKGFTIMITGYNEKIPVLIELIANTMKSIGDNLSKKIFEAVLEKQCQDSYNELLNPSSLCSDQLSSILLVEQITSLDEFNALKNITFESMVNFSRNLLKSLYLQALVQGNVTSSTAIDATNIFLNVLDYSPLTAENYPKLTVNVIPNGEYSAVLS